MIKFFTIYYSDNQEKNIREDIINGVTNALLEVGITNFKSYWKKDVINSDSSIRKTFIVKYTYGFRRSRQYSYTIKPWLNENNCSKFKTNLEEYEKDSTRHYSVY